MAEDQNNKENTTTSDTNNTSEYEDVCYICRRPESVAGKMIHIQPNLCICNDCMQKTFDSMSNGNFGNLGNLGNISNMEFPDLYQNVITPNLIVFLDVNDEQRIKRSHDRCDENMPKIFLNHNFNKRLKQFFLKQNQVPCVFLNTENLDPLKMVDLMQSMQLKNTHQPQHWFLNKFYNLR